VYATLLDGGATIDERERESVEAQLVALDAALGDPDAGVATTGWLAPAWDRGSTCID
jgi:hypothetical protein